MQAIHKQYLTSTIVFGAFCFMLCAILVGCRQQVKEGSKQDKPNILLIFTDDQKWNTIGRLGNPEIHTPNLDKLSEQSFIFQNAYCFGGNSGAVCIPARNMLMSGQVFFRFEQDKKFHEKQGKKRRAPWYTNPEWPSIPKSMKLAGYETFYREKSGSANSPDVREQFDHRKDIHMVNALRTGRPARSIVDDAITFMANERNKQMPFFMYLGFPCPHDPRWSIKRFRDLYDPDKLSIPPNYTPVHNWDIGDMTIRDERLEKWPRTKDAIKRHLHDYYSVISSMDYDIGRLMRAVDSLQLNENTIIVFSSDQGLAMGDHGLMGKQNIYEGTMKVPLLIRGPGIPVGKSDAFAYIHDIYPTLCDIGGTTIPIGLDGRSLWGTIQGNSPKVRDHVILAYKNSQRSVRISNWKYIHYPQIDRAMLFNLDADPYEINNLVEKPEYASTVESMKKALQQELLNYGDSVDLNPSATIPASFDPPKEKLPTAFPAGGLAPEDPSFEKKTK